MRIAESATQKPNDAFASRDNKAYSQLFQIPSSPVHSAEECVTRELGLVATHGFIENPEMYKQLSSSHVMDEHHVVF